MAGHSKWANIQYRKGVQDAKRGKIFTKLIREITVAARSGGGDAAHNPRLRHAIEKALGQNMSKDNIERAIKRGTGELEGAHYEEIRYEGYGPGGVAILVDCQTDNRNRTVGEVRHAFTKYGGNLGTDGSVAYLFKKVGVIFLTKGVTEDAATDAALDAGADDVVVEADGTVEVVTTHDTMHKVREGLERKGMKVTRAELTERPETAVAVDGEEAQQLLKLLEVIEELDDVQSVYTNAEVSDAALARHVS